MAALLIGLAVNTVTMLGWGYGLPLATGAYAVVAWVAKLVCLQWRQLPQVPERGGDGGLGEDAGQVDGGGGSGGGGGGGRRQGGSGGRLLS